MKVLLLSRNRVVQELVKLGVHSREEVELEVAERPEEIRGDHYDFLLVDERFEQEFHPLETMHLIVGRRILLGGSESAESAGYDGHLDKPFLPGEVREVVKGEVHPSSGEGEEDLQRFLAEEWEQSEGTEILDEEEIHRIRALLDDTGGGNEPEGEERIDEVFAEEEEYRLSAEELLELLERVRSKKLRKLLQGATIHISIEFPEEG